MVEENKFFKFVFKFGTFRRSRGDGESKGKRFCFVLF